MVSINLNLPIGTYTITNLTASNKVYCQIVCYNEESERKYVTGGTFTISDENCKAQIILGEEAGTTLENAKVGCMLNSGSVALPFSEYTDVAVVKDN